MKKRFILLFAVVMIFSVSTVYASETGNVLNNSRGPEAEVSAPVSRGNLVPEETITVDKVCDITYLGCVADDIAMSIPAYMRDENETVKTPSAKALNGDHWNDRVRYKYKKNGESNPYADMYVAIGAALKPQSDDYKLLDIRLDILNRSITPLDLAERLQAKLFYEDGYEFELTTVMTEVTDTAGNKNEWLTDEIEIPVLVNKIVHLIFEVPNVVATDTAPLSASVILADNEFGIEIR